MSELDAIKNKLSEKPTEELLGIWTANNRDGWRDEAFDAIHQILTERDVQVPNQPPPIPKKKGPNMAKPLLVMFVVGAAYIMCVDVVYTFGVQTIPRMTLRAFSVLLGDGIGGSLILLIVPSVILYFPQLFMRLAKRPSSPKSYLRCYVGVWVLCIIFHFFGQSHILR